MQWIEKCNRNFFRLLGLNRNRSASIEDDDNKWKKVNKKRRSFSTTILHLERGMALDQLASIQTGSMYSTV